MTVPRTAPSAIQLQRPKPKSAKQSTRNIEGPTTNGSLLNSCEKKVGSLLSCCEEQISSLLRSREENIASLLLLLSLLSRCEEQISSLLRIRNLLLILLLVSIWNTSNTLFRSTTIGINTNWRCNTTAT